MRKHIKGSKSNQLSLNRESIRLLGPAQLDGARGAGGPPPPPTLTACNSICVTACGTDPRTWTKVAGTWCH